MFSLCSWNAVGKTWPAAREHEPSEPIWCSFSVLAWPTFVTMSFGVLYLAHQAFLGFAEYRNLNNSKSRNTSSEDHMSCKARLHSVRSLRLQRAFPMKA